MLFFILRRSSLSFDVNLADSFAGLGTVLGAVWFLATLIGYTNWGKFCFSS